jgi:hypothetical protein
MAKPDVAGTIKRAREQQRRSRELCRDAADVQRRVLVSQGRLTVPARGATASPPWSGWAAIDRNGEGRK